MVRAGPTGHKVLTLTTGSQAGVARGGCLLPSVTSNSLQHRDGHCGCPTPTHRRVGAGHPAHGGSGSSEGRRREGGGLRSPGVSPPLSGGQAGPGRTLLTGPQGAGPHGLCMAARTRPQRPRPCLNPGCGHAETKPSSGRCSEAASARRSARAWVAGLPQQLTLPQFPLCDWRGQAWIVIMCRAASAPGTQGPWTRKDSWRENEQASGRPR